MKKLMFFILSLFFFVGAMAQIDTENQYRIKASTQGSYLTVGTSNHNSYGHVYGAAKDESNQDQVFTFVDAGNGKYYLKSLTGKYFSDQGTGYGWNVNYTESETQALAMTFETAGENSYYISCYNTKNAKTQYFKYEYVAKTNDGGDDKYHPFCDATKAAAAIWVLEPVITGPVPYTVKVLGTTDASAGVSFEGVVYNNNGAINIEKAVTKSDFTAIEVVGAHSVINIDGTTVYVSYFDNSAKFYTILNHTNGYMSTSSEYCSGSYLKLTNPKEPKDNRALWTFEAQSGGGYKIYNYSTGRTKVLGMTGSEDNARASMVDPNSASHSIVFDGTIDFNNGSASYIKIKGSSNNYWNKRNDNNGGGHLALWNDSEAYTNQDNGSKFYLNAVDYANYPDYYVYEITDIEGIGIYEPKNPNTMWYQTSAASTGVSNIWQEYALPLGNGELGCMVFGGVHTEELQFNEKTLWSGPANVVGADDGKRTFVNFGSLYIINNDNDIYDGVTDYVRYLDLEEGIAGVEFKNAKGKKQVRKYFSSAPDSVIVGHYKADEGEVLNLTFELEPGDGIGASAVTYENGAASFTGAMEAVKYAARLYVVANDGATITTNAGGINVNDASEVTFFLKGGTNFNGDMDVFTNYFTNETKADVNNRLKADVETAAAKSYATIEAAHISDFSALTKRMTFNLGLNTPTVDTKTLVDRYYPNNQSGNSTDNDHLFLEQLYFHYGRYLAISSNRKPIAAPNNLQGIWNNLNATDSKSVWNSDIHTNINIQMNYWPTEVTNLSDLHLPFLNFIIRGAQSEGWKKVAQQYNGGYGWSVLTETSLYNSMSTWGDKYLVANVWYTSHLWMHYRYTQDKEFLKKAFPVMWSCAEFWFHRLVKASDGTYEAPNEYSPEHGPGHGDTTGENATAHAQQMISYLFQNLKDAVDELGASELNLTAADVAKLDDYLKNVDKGLATESCQQYNNGVSYGTTLLREWKYSSHTRGELGHRHMSHLMALYPMEQITPESEFFEPAVNSLLHRGDEATGWSMGWKVNLWARAQDGDHAHIIIKNALRHAAGNGGVYYNLFDAHPPFQIDGNFGVCSGIAEMLMQSAHGYISILPALPKVWEKSGDVKGMKAVGNFTVDFRWADGKCQSAKIVSNAGAELKVRCKRGAMELDKARVTVNGKVVAVTVDVNGIASIPCEKDEVVEIDFTTETAIAAVEAEAANEGAIYDINGRRVNEMEKNKIYIQDGVKKLSK